MDEYLRVASDLKVKQLDSDLMIKAIRDLRNSLKSNFENYEDFEENEECLNLAEFLSCFQVWAGAAAGNSWRQVSEIFLQISESYLDSLNEK